MATRIDARELREVFRQTPAEQNVLLVGKHGIGKSQIITRYFQEEHGMPVIAFFLGQMSDPGDLIGLMHKDEKSGRSVFLPPYWWPVDGQPIVLFLDELNRARPEILQSIHELALNKTLAGKRLPEGSVVVSAVNEGDEYQLTDLDPALVSRFNLYEFAPTVEDWLLWASAAGIDERVMTFIQKNSHFLDGDGTADEEWLAHAGLVKAPDRRAWERVSQFLEPIPRLDELHVKIISGIVGTSAALAFFKSLSQPVALTAEQVLLHFSKNKKALKALALQDLVVLNEQITLWINAGHCPEKDQNKARRNLLAYTKHLQMTDQQEAVAHLASQLQNPKFEQAMLFTAASLELIELLTEYLEGIRVD